MAHYQSREDIALDIVYHLKKNYTRRQLLSFLFDVEAGEYLTLPGPMNATVSQPPAPTVSAVTPAVVANATPSAGGTISGTNVAQATVTEISQLRGSLPNESGQKRARYSSNYDGGQLCEKRQYSNKGNVYNIYNYFC